MDNNQIKLFVEHNIKNREPGDQRLALEVEHFVQALCQQKDKMQKEVTPDIIIKAWDSWKQERFEYLNIVRTHREANSVALEKLALDYINKIEDTSEPRIKDEANRFAKSFAQQLEFLAIQPPEEHLAQAWKNWKSGYRS